MNEDNKYTEAAVNFEAVQIAMTKTKDGIVLKMAMHPDEVPDSILRAHVGQRYMVAMVALDEYENPVAPPEIVAGKKAVQQAGILCHDPKFQEFLGDQVGDLLLDDDACAKALCAVLCIESRKEIASDSSVREQFKEIVGNFYESRK